MQKIGPKELALKEQREKNLTPAHKMMIADGLPAKLARIGGLPKPRKQERRSDGVSLAPPLAVQKAIAADLADEPLAPSILDASGKPKVGTLKIQNDLDVVNAAVKNPKQIGGKSLAELATIIQPAPKVEPKANSQESTVQTQTASKTNAPTTKAKTTVKAKGATKAAVKKNGATKSPATKRKGGYDWEGAEALAKLGKLPLMPSFQSYKPHIKDILDLAKKKDLAGIKEYMTRFCDAKGGRANMFRFKDICVEALKH